jgi:hypothetical protein
MTDPVKEQAYRWPRRSIFAVTLAVIIALLMLCVLLV